MYRYIVDNAITYTPDDLVLYRESPFAVWMERLTLENPEHGIPPDLDSIGNYPQSPQQDDIVTTLRAEGRNVALIDPQQNEPECRVATLEAMRSGADFIVNGQLAVDNLSAAVDLLMRTSGFSELGDFLYIPCETRVDKSLQSPFRLCFVAELLANLQGQVPAQMLIIRGGAEVVPLQTEDHIYYFRAVQKRFISAMSEFRKHRMPDPSESAHFGRWAECASEVLKQRALSEQQPDEDEQVEETAEAVAELPQLRVASGAGAASQYDSDGAASPREFVASGYKSTFTAPEPSTGYRSEVSYTLADQARELKPGSYRNGKPPGHTPSLARIGKPLAIAAEQETASKPPVEPTADVALDNLEFIGSRANSRREADFEMGEALSPAPAPNLRETSVRDRQTAVAEIKSSALQLPEREPRPPVFLPPDQIENEFDRGTGGAVETPHREQLKTQQQDVAEHERDDSSSVVDMDSAPVSTLAPVVQRAEAVFKRMILDDPMFKKAEPAASKPERKESNSTASPFSNSLRTSEEFNES